MHIMILGAGITGVTTAWYLRNAGFTVTVVDRQPAAGLETSYANGGQISISHPEPWSSPAAPLIALRWLGRKDAPLRFRLGTDPARWRWLLEFLGECLPYRYRRNAHAIAGLAVHSGRCLRAVRSETGLPYNLQTRGILHMFRTREDYAGARHRLEFLTRHGIPARLCRADECVDIEPALRASAGQLVGGLYAPDDESGDAMQFTCGLAEQARAAGVEFHFNTTVERLQCDRATGTITGVEITDAAGDAHILGADAYVLCLGSYSPGLVPHHGERLPIYPVKGYSITAPLRDPAKAPCVSLTDETRRIVCSRLGDAVRVAGTAEICGYDTIARPERCAPLVNWLESMFPGACDGANAIHWAGLRPCTPSNVPIIGRGRSSNLWYNTGHGTLGWTLACGSASSLVDLMSGRAPPVDGFPFLRMQRVT